MPTPPLSDEACLEALAALKEHGTATEAALALNMPRETFQSRLKNARHRFGDQPLDQGHGNAPDGWRVKGTSTLFDADGVAKLQWVKTTADMERQRELMEAAVSAMCADIEPAAPVDGPLAVITDLCNLYTYSDFHLGMLAQEEEGGADWDIKIAERTLVASFAAMIAQSPASQTAVLNIQGDMLHSDGLLPVTPIHRHVLDQDGRFSRIVATAIRSIRQLMRMALEKHDEVHLVVCEGNHDEASSVWLRHMFQALYENEPRVTVNTSELPFYVFEWGQTMLGFHHGHKVKNEQLPLLFAAQFPEAWGRTKRRAIHCGHRHHCDEKEYNGVTVVQHPTIAARDAYAARGGWIADRAVQSITYSKRFGQVGRVFVSPEMLEAA